MIAAVVPVAFFTEDHLRLTSEFLAKLHDEVDRIGVWHNGGPLASKGQSVLDRSKNTEVFDADGWRFFQMWNAGVHWAGSVADVALVLNNDILWPTGALRTLGEALAIAAPDIAAASPDPSAASAVPDPGTEFRALSLDEITATPAFRGLMGWCFAVRPALWQDIDERYQVWYGDDEIGLLFEQAGLRCVRARGVPVWHPETETTMRYRDRLWEMRAEDEALYKSKWGR